MTKDIHYVGATAWSGYPDGPFYSKEEAEAYMERHPNAGTFLIPAAQVDPEYRKRVETDVRVPAQTHPVR